MGVIAAWRRLSMHRMMRPLTERRIALQWRMAGRPIPPPPIVKQALVKAFQRRFDLRVFVETGTFAGEMIAAVADRFERVISIELDPGWHAKAVDRFGARPGVTLLQGDSGVRLREVLASVAEPALFWLDAHYAGPLTAKGALDSPVIQELDAIRAHRIAGHIVLIDDMRYFTGADGYPRAAELVEWIRAADPHGSVEIRDDILRWQRLTTDDS
jgi:hypothetical protein